MLTAWLSADDGKSWEGGLVFDERRGISYRDGFQAPDGLIYVSYDRNRSTDGEILLGPLHRGGHPGWGIPRCHVEKQGAHQPPSGP